MKTEDLIRALATDLAPEPPLTDGVWLRLGLAFAICAALVGLALGFREDLGAALLNPVSTWRIVLSLALCGVGLRLALLLAQPAGAASLRLSPLLGVAGAAVLAVVWALIGTPPADWGQAVTGTTLVWCLFSIPVLSVVPVTMLFILLRRGATARPRLLGALAGLAGGGMAAAAYALHCTEDSPLFYVTWSGLAIGIVTVISSLIGARLLRW